MTAARPSAPARKPAPLRVVVADDEPLSRRAVTLFLSNRTDVTVVADCEDGAEAVAAIQELEPDVVILDIHMPELDGFEVLEQLEHRPAVIFLTAFSEHAVDAFAIAAVDYLLKPIDEARFHEALERAQTVVASQRRDPYLRRLSYRHGFRVRIIDTREVEWIQAADYYARVHTRDGRSHLIRHPLSVLETRLDPSEFVRVHRSAIVRIEAIRESCIATSEVLLRNGTRIRTSRVGRARLAEILARQSSLLSR